MFFWINVFTSNKTKNCMGNGAGVVVSDENLFNDAGRMQTIAKEVNLSETAFILKVEKDTYKIRFFTPSVEIDLCGHATLASAHVLFNELNVNEDELVFMANKDNLKVKKINENLQLTLPRDEFIDSFDEYADKIKKALSVDKVFKCVKGSMDLLVEVEGDGVVNNLKPDLDLLKEINARGVMVASTSETAQADVVFRFFAPASGIDEDPATGSAMCLLAPYFSKVLNKDLLQVFQASPRGGFLETKLYDDFVEVTGKSQTFLKGEIS